MKHYDQIAFNLHLEEGIKVLDDDVKSGAFNFVKSIYNENDYEEYIDVMPNNDDGVKRTGEDAKKYFKQYYRINEISDHKPLWMALNVDFSDQYIEKQKKDVLQKEAEAKAKAEAKKNKK